MEYLLNTSTNVFCQHYLGKKASEVQQSWGAGAKLSGHHPPAHWTGIGPVNEGIMFVQEIILLFLFLFSVFCFWRVCMAVWELMWVNVFRMSFFCTDSGPWRKMSRAWPAMSAITTTLGSTCLSHQESAWGAAEARQERARRPLMWSSPEEHLPSFLKVACQYTGQEEDH